MASHLVLHGQTVKMPEAEKVLAIADLVLGCCVVLEGIVAIIWTFDTVFQLAIFVIGCYQIFFGAWGGSGALSVLIGVGGIGWSCVARWCCGFECAGRGAGRGAGICWHL